VKALPVILMLVLPALTAIAQEKQPVRNDDVLQSINDWMQQNLDDDVLDALNQIDQNRVREIFNAVQERFADTNVLDLGSLREAADRALPALQQFEETRPYAVWLQTRLDYMDAANDLRRETEPATNTPPDVAAAPSAPSVKLEREVWTRQLAKRPWPPLAQNCVPRLKEIFQSEKMPPELVWVAEVESSFDPTARSPAGAAGMFQLMAAAARDQKLSLWPTDERLEPDKSAHAAARMLRQLYARYGDWRLALAAYNAGPARVDKLLKQQNASSYDAIARFLPAETQMYVPKIEATLRKREGMALADLKMPKV
jgi:membrane-bound lytic murein transglycosylase D